MKRLLARLILIVFLINLGAFTAGCNITAMPSVTTAATTAAATATTTAATTTAAAGTTAAPSAKPAARLIFDLSEWLEEDKNELKGIPWLSPFETACQALGLTSTDVTIGEKKTDQVDLIVPVYLEPFGRDAFMALEYVYQYEVNGILINDGGSALTGIQFITAVEDEAAIRDMLRTLLDVVDRPGRPMIRSDKYIPMSERSIEEFIFGFVTIWETAGWARQWFSGTQEIYYDVTLDRDCVAEFMVDGSGYQLEATGDISDALGNPTIMKINLLFSMMEPRGSSSRRTTSAVTTAGR